MAPKSLSVLFSCLIILSSLSTTTSQTPPQSEQQILLTLKEAFGSPPALQSWNTSTPHCTWAGVNCTGGSVTALNLYQSNITEPMPAVICSLKNLSYLDLSFNYLPGTFPTALYNCSSLQYLDISQNLFVGPLPLSISQLSNQLYHLALSSNNFTGDIPSSIGQFPSLQTLRLDNNLFNSTFPAELGNLSSLLYLSLANNPFAPATLPAEFGNMTSLAYLWMTSTGLHGEIPQSLEKLSNLVQLDLAMNSLTGPIPAGVWMLKKLERINLFHNNLTGDINKTIGAWSLAEIDLSMNELSGPIPTGFGELQNLTVLFLYLNQLSGQIPEEIGLLQSLTDLRLFNNQLMGSLPAELGKRSNLRNLEVNNNSLSGELPQSLCAGGDFASLVAFDNNFIGSLPASLGRCRTLNNLMAQNNNFRGEIPAGLWSMAVNLTTLVLHHNSFSGNLPDVLPWNLTRLEIQSNRFSGNISSSATRLVVFKADDNLFAGALPADFFLFSRLQTLSVGGNEISGEIPDSILALKSLTQLNLSKNRLSGEIPAVIGSLPVLITVDLSDNQLSGPIPAQMGNLKLSYLNLSSNDLSGEVPASLQNSAYDQSFLSNPNLCSSNSSPTIRFCEGKPGRSSKPSAGLLAALIVLSLVILAAVVWGLSMQREHRRQKRANVRTSPSKLTSFHSIDFNESNIEEGLTEENLIGKGGGGLVYKVVLASRAGETLAVKKIWNSRKLDINLQKEFAAEVKILGSVRHANVVKLLCCISRSDSKLLVYEYMENESLDRWLHSSRRAVFGRSMRSVTLDWPIRLAIAVGAAKGLCYLHHGCTLPIVHRDVKASNILLDLDFNAKIADFGLSRMLVKPGESVTVSAMAGTFGYMAPECAWMPKVTVKMDVYSFGVVLLELTTGREARYDDEDSCLAEWASRHFNEGTVNASAIAEEIRDIPSYLREIMEVFTLGITCTGKLPEGRPSMEEVAQVLERIMRVGVGEYDGTPLIGTEAGSSLRRLAEDEGDECGDDSRA